jgi:hypothetical protein
MFVKKRNGTLEAVHFDKITSRITRLCYGLNTDYVDPVLVSQKVCMGVYRGVTTAELDELAAETAAHLTSLHPDFGLLAARIAISNLHKSTSKSFSDTATILYEYIEPRTNLPAPMLSEACYRFIMDNSTVLNSTIVYDRDFLFDYFGFKTLQHSYLLKATGKVVERPQHLIMRAAIGIHAANYNSENKCIGEGTIITLANGMGFPIESLVKSDSFNLLGYNSDIDKLQNTTGICVHTGSKPILAITLENGQVLKVTKDHKIQSNGTYVKASNLEVGCTVTVGASAPDCSYELNSEWHLQLDDVIFDLKNRNSAEKTFALARIMGFFLADGSMLKYSNKDCKGSMCLGHNLDVKTI